ncbi:MAG: endonuclease VII domain-containing protein [Bradyrhizobium sp.]|nr:endonuclease VII domain-containing protein [Bradyrhizobium sp.]
MSISQSEKKRAKKREYYERNAEKCRQASRDWYAKNRKRAADQRRAYVARNREAVAERKAIYKYGVSNAVYQSMFDAQGGVCAICGGSEPDKRRARLAIDHCHTTGKIRGLLCSRCNTALGLLGDEINVLRAAIAYLRPASRHSIVVAEAA